MNTKTNYPLILYFLLIHLGVGAVALGTLALLTPSLTLGLNWLPALLVGAAAGGLWTAAVRRDLTQIEAALDQLIDGNPLAPLIGRWPLGQLMVRLNEFGGQSRQVSRMRGVLAEQIRETAAQEERHRLARDLHDSIKQQIYSMHVGAAAVQAHMETDPERAWKALADVRRSAKEAMVEMNALLQQLRPAALEKIGLVAALREQCEALSYRTDARVQTHFSPLPPDERLPAGTQESVFRIAQEALANIARHARAKEVHLRLFTRHTTGNGQLVLEIADDGQGFDPEAASQGMGLSNIRQRAAALDGAVHVQSHPGEGTILTVTIPLQSEVGATIDAIGREVNERDMGRFFRGMLILFGLALVLFFLVQIVSFPAFPVIALAIFSLVSLGGNWWLVSRNREAAVLAAMDSRVAGTPQEETLQGAYHSWQAVLYLQAAMWTPIQSLYWLKAAGLGLYLEISVILFSLFGLLALVEWLRAIRFERKITSRLSDEKILKFWRGTLFTAFGAGLTALVLVLIWPYPVHFIWSETWDEWLYSASLLIFIIAWLALLIRTAVLIPLRLRLWRTKTNS